MSKRSRLMELLTEQPGMSYTEAAAIIGCTPIYVLEIKRELRAPGSMLTAGKTVVGPWFVDEHGNRSRVVVNTADRFAADVVPMKE